MTASDYVYGSCILFFVVVIYVLGWSWHQNGRAKRGPNQTLAMYGLIRNRPVWFVEKRGLNWLRYGFCPCCYSSPPRPKCRVCEGDYRYGAQVTSERRTMWRVRWLTRTKVWRGR